MKGGRELSTRLFEHTMCVIYYAVQLKAATMYVSVATNTDWEVFISVSSVPSNVFGIQQMLNKCMSNKS